MKTSKILLQINNLCDVDFYKKLGVTNFLFPLKDYSVGYNSYTFNEISKYDNAYVLVNRLLTDEDIDNFLKLSIPKNIKGFVLEDTGMYEILKDKGYTLINFQNHLNNNYKTINYWLKYFDSLVISTDITLDEIKCIIDKSSKNLVLNTFGYPMIMYSRRTLITNFYRHLGMNDKHSIIVRENASNAHFFMSESYYGTSVFNKIPFDYRSIINEIDDKKIMFYLINSSYIDKNIMKDVIDGKDVSASRGFLDKKTIYKVGDIK